MLAMVFALAALPALCGDYFGLWYLNFFSPGERLESSDVIKVYTEDVLITIEAFSLNSDGTVTRPDADGSEAAAGIWEAVDAGIRLAVDGNPIELAVDEAGLLNAEQGGAPDPGTFTDHIGPGPGLYGRRNPGAAGRSHRG